VSTLPATQPPGVPANDSEEVNVIHSQVDSTNLPRAAEPNPSIDRERTERRYEKAVEKLTKAITLPRKNWEAFEIPDFKNLADVTDPIRQLQDDIAKTLDARNNAFKDPSFWSKTKRVTEGVFTTISPFVKNILLVSKEGSSVFPS
jgi:hypothetical protein